MALVANEVDFAIMFAFLAIPVRAKAGMSFLVDLTDLNVEYQGSTIATRRTFIQKYPNVTARLLHAIIRGVHFFNTRKEDTVRILAKFVWYKRPRCFGKIVDLRGQDAGQALRSRERRSSSDQSSSGI